ncbi:hypothetical protein FHX15_006195 [Rhizobium sp. BK650]|nr:hypothetical protein [Rhizobium sp. BK650]
MEAATKKIDIRFAFAVFAQRQQTSPRNAQRLRVSASPQTDNRMRIAARQQQKIAGVQGDFTTGAKANETVAAQDQMKWQRACCDGFVIDMKGAL